MGDEIKFYVVEKVAGLGVDSVIASSDFCMSPLCARTREEDIYGDRREKPDFISETEFYLAQYITF